MSAGERAIWRSQLLLAVVVAVVVVGLAFGAAPATVLALLGALAVWGLPPVGTPAWSRFRHRVAVVVLRVVPAVVGSAVLLVALDWGLGAGEARLAGDRPPDPDSVVDASLPPTTDERVHSPAYAGAAWADRYFAELQRVPYDYVPYVGAREATFHGRYINTDGGVRRSYEPAGLDGDEAVDIWFLGGSTTWGEGQRDDHTIASEVARVAERHGTPVRVWNFGIRGATAFQDLLVLERELAHRPRPDLVVFYQGANELYSQLEAASNLSAQPSIYQHDVNADAFEAAPPEPGHSSPRTPSVLAEYGDTSVLGKLLRAAADGLSSPAGADEPGPRYQPPLADQARAGREAEQIYRRTVALQHHVAASHEVPMVIFWQPAGEPANTGYRALSARVAHVGGGVDLSAILDDARTPVYIDGGHTNEVGARIVADAMWPHLAAALHVDGRSG